MAQMVAQIAQQMSAEASLLTVLEVEAGKIVCRSRQTSGGAAGQSHGRGGARGTPMATPETPPQNPAPPRAARQPCARSSWARARGGVAIVVDLGAIVNLDSQSQHRRYLGAGLVDGADEPGGAPAVVHEQQVAHHQEVDAGAEQREGGEEDVDRHQRDLAQLERDVPDRLGVDVQQLVVLAATAVAPHSFWNQNRRST